LQPEQHTPAWQPAQHTPAWQPEQHTPTMQPVEHAPLMQQSQAVGQHRTKESWQQIQPTVGYQPIQTTQRLNGAYEASYQTNQSIHQPTSQSIYTMPQTLLPTGNSIYGQVPLRPIGQNQQQTDIAPQKLSNGNDEVKSNPHHISEEYVKHGIQPPRYDTVMQRRGTQKQPKDTTPSSVKYSTGKSTSGSLLKQKNKTVGLSEAIRDIENKASKDHSHDHHFLEIPSLKKIPPNLDPLHMEINMSRT